MPNNRPLSTNELAAQLGIQPTSIRVRLCRHGNYFGVTPLKMVNHRLVWPADTLDRLVVGVVGRGNQR